MEWTTEWPTEPGTYWFYGYRYGYDGRLPNLNFVEIRSLQNSHGGWSLVGITRGAFMYKQEGHDGLWLPAELPPLPSVGEMEEAFT